MTWTILTLWGARLILVVLVGLSVWSVSVMIDRHRALSERDGAKDGVQWNQRVRELILAQNWKDLSGILRGRRELSAGALLAALEVTQNSKSAPVSRQSVELAVKSYLSQERVGLERGFTVLATLGSNAPFIGLFGTVLGIIQAFGVLGGDGTAGGAAQGGVMTTVMGSISEALVATAIGLFVAIPAVVAYNVFSRRLRLMMLECESLRDYFLSRINS